MGKGKMRGEKGKKEIHTFFPPLPTISFVFVPLDVFSFTSVFSPFPVGPHLLLLLPAPLLNFG